MKGKKIDRKGEKTRRPFENPSYNDESRHAS